MKIVAILYKGGEAAKQEPRLLGTVENEVGALPDAFFALSHTVSAYSSVSAPGSSPKATST